MFLSITLVALTNDVSADKIERWIDEGKLPDPMTWNGVIGWEYDTLQRWLDRTRSTAPATPVSTPAKREAIGPKLRFEVLMRDGFACRYCGQRAPAAVLQVDHIVPVASGGATTLDNLQAACQECNAGKSDQLIPGIQP